MPGQTQSTKKTNSKVKKPASSLHKHQPETAVINLNIATSGSPNTATKSHKKINLAGEEVFSSGSPSTSRRSSLSFCSRLFSL